MEPTTELTPIQLKLITRVANGFSLTEAAHYTDTERPILMDWRRTIPPFREALDQAIRDREALNQERMVALAWVATTVVREIMESEKASPSIRLRAAQTVLKAAAAIKKSEAQEAATKTENVHNSAQQPIRLAPDPARNSLCPCGSGNKFKRCCANPVPQAIPTAA
jgi:uncharacterized protein YecA (UPF0149 family)